MTILQDLRDSRTAVFGFVVIGIGWATFSAQMPVIKAQIGASDALYGAMSLLAAAGALMAMWLAPFVHRVLGRWAMVAGGFVMLVGFGAMGWVAGPIGFTLALFLAAAGSGVADVLANAEISECESATGRSLMNLNHGMFSVAYGVTAVAVSFGRGADWSAAELFAAMSVAVLLLCPLLVLPNRASHSVEEQSLSHIGLPHAIVWLGGVVVLSAFTGEVVSEGWSALHLERTLEATAAQGALGPAILGFSMAIGRLGGHVLFARLQPMRVMGFATCLAVVGLMVAAAAPTAMVAYVGFALTGLGVSVVGPLALGLVGQAVPSCLRLAAISRAAALGYGASFLGPPMMGFVSQAFGLRIAFFVMSLALLVVVVVVLPAWSRKLEQKGVRRGAVSIEPR